jgi:hypothetical protein
LIRSEEVTCPPALRTIVVGRTIPLEASGMARFSLFNVAEIVAACAERHPLPKTPTNTGSSSDFTTPGLERKEEFIKAPGGCYR